MTPEEMCNFAKEIGYDLVIDINVDHIAASVFGSISKTYLSTMAYSAKLRRIAGPIGFEWDKKSHDWDLLQGELMKVMTDA